MKARTLLLGLALAAGASTPAFAATQWNLTSGNNNNPTHGNSRTFSADGIGLTASAWSDAGGSGSIRNAYLPVWSGGLGVENRAEGIGVSQPQHAMDNRFGTDSILLTFTDVIALESLKLGWTYYSPQGSTSGGTYNQDAQLTVLAYTGAGIPAAFGGSSYGSLTSSGWTHIGDYFANYNSNTSINAGSTASSYWLVSAYNPVFSGNASSWHEYAKLAAVSGSVSHVPPATNAVPEPGSLALLGLGLVGLVSARRRVS